MLDTVTSLSPSIVYIFNQVTCSTLLVVNKVEVLIK